MLSLFMRPYARSADAHEQSASTVYRAERLPWKLREKGRLTSHLFERALYLSDLRLSWKP